MLQLEFFEDTIQDLWGQCQLGRSERCVVPRYNHLHDLSSREALCIMADALDDFVRDSLHSDQLLAREDGARVAVEELKLLHLGLGWLAILHQVMVEHGLALRLAGKGEVDHLIDTIVDGRIELVWRVRRHHHDNFV